MGGRAGGKNRPAAPDYSIDGGGEKTCSKSGPLLGFRDAAGPTQASRTFFPHAETQKGSPAYPLRARLTSNGKAIP